MRDKQKSFANIRILPCDCCSDGYGAPLFFGLIKRLCKRCGGYTKIKNFRPNPDDTRQINVAQRLGIETFLGLPVTEPINCRCVISVNHLSREMGRHGESEIEEGLALKVEHIRCVIKKGDKRDMEQTFNLRGIRLNPEMREHVGRLLEEMAAEGHRIDDLIDLPPLRPPTHYELRGLPLH